jgi:hypothetical protein
LLQGGNVYYNCVALPQANHTRDGSARVTPLQFCFSLNVGPGDG